MTNYFVIIFCKLYQWVRSIDAEDLPQYTAWALYSILLSLNICSLFGYGYYWVKGFPLNIFSKLYVLYLVLAVLGLLYFYFIRNRRYIKMYKNYTAILVKRSSGVVTVVYILVTLLFFISLLWL